MEHNERIGDNQYGFGRNRSTTDHMSYIRHIMEKNGSMVGYYTSC